MSVDKKILKAKTELEKKKVKVVPTIEMGVTEEPETESEERQFFIDDKKVSKDEFDKASKKGDKKVKLSIRRTRTSMNY